MRLPRELSQSRIVLAGSGATCRTRFRSRCSVDSPSINRSRAGGSDAPCFATALRVAHAADAIGIRGIVVHAISEPAKAFYQALGFDPSPSEPMTLMVTLADIRELLD